MEILTEFDELQEAMKKINLDESVFPYVNGRLVDSDSYNKAQKILNCPEMITAHKFIYDCDMDQLTEDEVVKIDKLYDLGVNRGFIIDDLTKWDEEEPSDEEKPAETQPEDAPAPKNTLFKAKVPCWTIIYSATKDGDIKTGEAYSNAVSSSAAKADVNAKLSRLGYSNITILAIESCDGAYLDTNATGAEVKENDMLRNRPHNNHIDDPAGVVNEADDEDDSGKDEDEDAGDDAEDDSSDDSADDTADDSDDGTADDSDSSDEETSDDTSDEGADDDTSDEGSDEETSDEDSSDEEAEESKEDDSKDDSEDASDDEGNDEDDEDSDDSEEPKDDDKKELSAADKADLKDKYRRAFKNTLVKCKFDTSFNDLTLEQKVKFFTQLAKTWTKNEPNEFMTDKEIEQLNNVVAQPVADEQD